MAGALTILSGPPGAGKSTLARRLAETSAAPAIHLEADQFFAAVRSGFILPWLPESNDQNRTINFAVAAAARAYGLGGYQVFIDGVVGPWFLDIFRAAAGEAGLSLDYVVLRPDLETAAARARERAVGPLPDYPPRIYEGFAELGPLEAHVIDSGAADVEGVVAAIREGLQAGRFRLV